MLELSRDQRRLLIEKVPDVANLAAGALVFGQFLGAQQFALGVAVFGVMLWSILIGWTLFLARGQRR